MAVAMPALQSSVINRSRQTGSPCRRTLSRVCNPVVDVAKQFDCETSAVRSQDHSETTPFGARLGKLISGSWPKGDSFRWSECNLFSFTQGDQTTDSGRHALPE